MAVAQAGGAEIRVACSPGERRVVLLRDDRIEAFAIERPDLPDGLGDVHAARVSAVSTAMSGAFLTMAGGETGFLPENETPSPRRPIAQVVSEGDLVLVRTTRAPQGGKGPRLSMRVANPPPHAGDIALLARGEGPVLRMARLWPEAPVIVDLGTVAAALRPVLGSRVTLARGRALEAEEEEALEELGASVVELGQGARLSIHPTPALVAIDVDAGTAAGGADPLAHHRLNERAVREVARQIRLRSLAGAILLDLAGLSTRKREALLAPLQAALAEDPLTPQLLGVTKGGLIEMIRRRVETPLHEVLGRPPSAATLLLAALRRAARDVAANPGRALALRAAPEVLAVAATLPRALAEYRDLAGRALALRPDAGLRPGQESIEEDGA